MRSKKTIYNIVANLLYQLVTIAYGFLIPKIIISKFGSDVNGLISSITQFLAYISLLESGFGPVVKASLYKPIARKNKNEIANILKTSEKFFKKIAIIFIVYIIALLFIYPQIVNTSFDIPFTISLIIIIGISTFAEYFFGITYKLYLQAEQKSYIVSISQIVTYILSIIVIISLAITGSDIRTIKLVSGIIFVIRPIFLGIYVRKKYSLDFKKQKGDYEIKQKWDGLVQHIAAVIHDNTDVTILSIFSNLAEVSVYSVYYLVVKGIKYLFYSLADGTDAVFGDMIAKKETTTLLKRFSTYELAHLMISTICFSCTMLLITPFVSIFTDGVKDANYIRPVFGYLVVIGEFIWSIRQPYNGLIKAAGHFRQTKTGAWIECISNILISIILVNYLGLIGVAIGTMVAMTIRTAEFIYYTNKHILKRNILISVNRIMFAAIEVVIIIPCSLLLPYLENMNYFNFFINALMTLIMSTAIVVVMNAIIYRKEMKSIIIIFKNILMKKKSHR